MKKIAPIALSANGAIYRISYQRPAKAAAKKK